MKQSILFIACALCSSFPFSAWPQETETPEWLAGLSSEVYVERKMAKEHLEANRREIFAHLSSMLQRPIQRGDPFYDSGTPRNMAIYLLGLYRFDEAIPLLIGCLVMDPTQIGVRDNPLVPVPAAEALRMIGSAATPALLATLKTTSDDLMADQCVKLVFDIEGPAEAGRAIRDVVHSEDIPTKARVANLLGALEVDRPGSSPD